jgi:hypothetical protein
MRTTTARRTTWIGVIAGLLLLGGVAGAEPGPDPAIRARALARYGQLPLAFEENRGQTDPRVKFLVRGSGFGLFLTPAEVVLSLREEGRTGAAHTVRLGFAGASRPAVSGQEALAGKANYLRLDGAPSQRGIPTYARVRFRELYPGIDLVFYGREHAVEHDFVVAPGADPRAIRWSIEGAEGVEVDPAGDLVLHLGSAEARLRRPSTYQGVGKARRAVASRYRLLPAPGGPTVGFELGAYDRTRPLVIDPVLVYSVLVGGSDGDSGNAIAVGETGTAYITGLTVSLDFPTAPPTPHAPGPVQPEAPEQDFRGDAFVYALKPDGSRWFATYLGTNLVDVGFDIAVRPGSIYVAGQTSSDDVLRGWVTRLDDIGSEILGSWIPRPGDSLVWSVALDWAGNVYATGGNHNSSVSDERFAFPFAVKLSPDLSHVFYFVPLLDLSFSTGQAIGVDAAGDAYVVLDFGLVTKLSPAGSPLYATSLPLQGKPDLAVDPAGDAYIVGGTSSPTFPTRNAFQSTLRGPSDAFVVKLSPAGETVYSTLLGGSGRDAGEGIAVDRFGNATVTGITESADFPLRDPLPVHCATGAEGCLPQAFVAKLNREGSALVYSTLLGGSLYDEGKAIAVDGGGDAYVTGSTGSPDFPTLHSELPYRKGDAFVARISAPDQPPVCASATATPATIWPPDGRLVPISIQGVTDREGGPITIAITGIFQDEPSAGKAPDATGLGTARAEVRAERTGGGDGRVYHLAFTATDEQGAACQGTVTVCVPHDQGKGRTCVDGGALYGSTGVAGRRSDLGSSRSLAGSRRL